MFVAFRAVAYATLFPMYVGAGLALAGTALFYESWALLAYCTVFILVMFLFVVVYEEPTLRATFGDPWRLEPACPLTFSLPWKGRL
jgi:phospholipid methyltransferase